MQAAFNTHFRQRIEALKPIVWQGFAKTEFSTSKQEGVAWSPVEQVRYEQHKIFASAVVDHLRWLVDHVGPIDPRELSLRADRVQAHLSPPQQEVFERIVAHVHRLLDRARTLRLEDVDRVIAELKRVEKLSTLTHITGEIHSLGVIVLRTTWLSLRDTEVDAVAFSRRMGVLREIDDPELRDLVSRTIIVFTKERHRFTEADLVRHEVMHVVYEQVIRPLDYIRYQQPMERQLFRECKDELIAYLMQGTWAYHPLSLSSTLRQPGVFDHTALETASDLLVRDLERQHPGLDRAELIHRADAFTDQWWNVIRIMARLSDTNLNPMEGVRAIITCEDFKEMIYCLRELSLTQTIYPEDIIERLPLRDPKRLCHELYQWTEIQDWLQLPPIEEPARLLVLLDQYIEQQPKQIVDEESIDHEEVLSRLQDTRRRVQRYVANCAYE